MDVTEGNPDPPERVFSGDEHLRGELRAAVGALRDLGPRYQPELVDSFMTRLRPRLDRRIDERLAAERPPSVWRSQVRSMALRAGAVAAALILVLPAAAGVIAGAHQEGFGARYGMWRVHEMRQHPLGQESAFPKPLLQPVKPVPPVPPVAPVAP